MHSEKVAGANALNKKPPFFFSDLRFSTFLAAVGPLLERPKVTINFLRNGKRALT